MGVSSWHFFETDHQLTQSLSNWFRSETIDDSFQPTMDMLLNVSIFLWYGAVCPWYLFDHNTVIPLYRLIILGILVLLEESRTDAAC